MDIELTNGVLRVQQTEFPKDSGQQFVDIRRFFDVDGQLQPTRKGVMIQLKDWDKVRQAIGGFSI